MPCRMFIYSIHSVRRLTPEELEDRDIEIDDDDFDDDDVEDFAQQAPFERVPTGDIDDSLENVSDGDTLDEMGLVQFLPAIAAPGLTPVAMTAFIDALTDEAMEARRRRRRT